MVCYMKKGGVAVAGVGTILLALPEEVPSVVSQVESVTQILAEQRLHAQINRIV